MRTLREGQLPVMFLYSLLLGAGLAVSSPWWGVRMVTTSRYRQGLRERLGRVPARVRGAVGGKRVVWLHAVSVGEVLAAAGLVRAMEAALAERDGKAVWRVMISTTTRTGQALARERFGAERVFWFPLDFAWAVRAWMRVLEPRIVLLVESELWPRLLAECRRGGVPVVVVNARMSDRSFRRAMRVRRLWGRILRGVSMFLAQSEETADRLRRLGVPERKVQVSGNLKYDLEPRPSDLAETLRPLLGRRPSVVAGSVLAGEEEMVLEAWREVLKRVPQAVLVLAPRHPEHFGDVARRVNADLRLVKASEIRAQGGPGHLEPRTVVLLDTVGDLAAVYGLGDVAFVGGSLVRKGGHNPLEPARFGVPVVVGPSFENFREIVENLEAENGIRIVQDVRSLRDTFSDLLTDPVEADALGQRGLGVFVRKAGATARTVEAALAMLPAGEPRRDAAAGVRA